MGVSEKAAIGEGNATRSAAAQVCDATTAGVVENGALLRAAEASVPLFSAVVRGRWTLLCVVMGLVAGRPSGVLRGEEEKSGRARNSETRAWR